VTSVDCNADLGESFAVWRLGDDEAILNVVTGANAACGFHAGDPAGLARAAGSTVSYVKPHCALYNTIVSDRVQARAVAEAVRAVLRDEHEIAAWVVTMVRSGRVVAADGTTCGHLQPRNVATCASSWAVLP
jgi:lactam utilization protein B